MLEFRLLGPLEVRSDGTLLSVTPKKARDLLTMLLIEGRSGATLDQIVEALWPGEKPNSAVNSVHVYISNLRKTLGDSDHNIIKLLEGGYRIDIDKDALDIQRFEGRISSGIGELEVGRYREALAAFDEALGMVYGRLLADVAGQPFAQIGLSYLEQRKRESSEGRLQALLALGSGQRVAIESKQFLHEDPYNEGVWALLIKALHQLNRRTEALRTYKMLADQLASVGLEPSVELRELERQVIAEDPSLNQAGPPQIGNLPARVEAPENGALVSLVSRDLEVERGVAIVGPDGLARSAAIGAAVASGYRFPDGVWLVDVRDQTQRRGAVPAILDVLGVIGGPDPEATLAQFSSRRTMLFVLTAADDLVAEVDGLVADLTSSDTRVLVTFERPPKGLDILLRDTSSASQTRPSGQVNDVERFTAPRATTSAAADLLFERLRCFQGPATMAAIRSVAAFDPVRRQDTEYLVGRLVANGQVVVDNSEWISRFERADMNRRSGAETPSEQLREQHLDYCMDLASSTLAVVGGAGWNDALVSIRAEQAELSAATEFALDRQRLDEAGRIGHAAGLYWSTQGSHLGKAMSTLGELLGLIQTDSADLAGISLSAGFAHFRSGSYQTAENLFNQAVAIAERVNATHLQGYARAERAHLLMFAGRHLQAQADLDRASALAKTSGLPALQCRVDMLTAQLSMRGEESAGQRWQHDTLLAATEVLERLRYRSALANCLLVLSSWHLDVYEARQAVDLARRAVEVVQLEDDRSMIAFALARLAECDRVAGDQEACFLHASEALTSAVEIGNWLVAATAALVLGLSDRAASLPTSGLLGPAFLAIRKELGVPVTARENEWLSVLQVNLAPQTGNDRTMPPTSSSDLLIAPAYARNVLFSVAASVNSVR